MRIHTPDIQQQDDQTIIAARIEFDSPQPALPRELTFQIPNRYHRYSSIRTDPFVAALILLAMHLGEPLKVHGKVSPRLAYGLEEYQKLFAVWYPGKMRPISIQYQDLQPPEPANQDGVAIPFSGGIDSFYTLKRHLPSSQPLPTWAVTHGVFISGFDTPLANLSDFDRLSQDYQEMFSQLGLLLIPIKTNVRYFSAPFLAFTITHGGALVAPGLLLDMLFQRTIIAPSFRYSHLRPWGSSPVSDHLLSTETLDVVHDSARGSRLDRITEISSWQLPQRHLRICANAPHTSYRKNCSRCDKCLRTMFMLDMLDRLAHFTTFHRKVTPMSILRWGMLYDFTDGFHHLFIKKARELDRRNLVPWFYLAAFLGWLHMLADRISPKSLIKPIKDRLIPPKKNPFIR